MIIDNTQKPLLLFTDGSVHAQSKIGYGAYQAVSDVNISLNSLKTLVKVKRFECTSSTKLELQTLLWALGEIPAMDRKIIIYTDSQNILKLPVRREQLEQNNYFSKNHKRLKNAELYQAFYAKSDQLNFEIVKVSGHKSSRLKDKIDKLFTLVDRASRNALRGG